jgi:hypothetical protein
MLKRLSLSALCAALFVSGPVAAKTKPPTAPDPVTCSGVFGADSSEELVREVFGAENVETGMVPGPEGTEMLATTVFPDDAERTMQFGWFDEENLTHLAYVRLAPAQTAPFGVRLGMTPAEIEAINGEAFTIGGFWWDYGGYAIIESGALTPSYDGCSLSLRFSPADEIDPKLDVTEVSGEVQVPSRDPLLETIDTRLEVLTLNYPWPEDLPQPEW